MGDSLFCPPLPPLINRRAARREIIGTYAGIISAIFRARCVEVSLLDVVKSSYLYTNNSTLSHIGALRSTVSPLHTRHSHRHSVVHPQNGETLEYIPVHKYPATCGKLRASSNSRRIKLPLIFMEIHRGAVDSRVLRFLLQQSCVKFHKFHKFQEDVKFKFPRAWDTFLPKRKKKKKKRTLFLFSCSTLSNNVSRYNYESLFITDRKFRSINHLADNLDGKSLSPGRK